MGTQIAFRRHVSVLYPAQGSAMDRCHACVLFQTERTTKSAGSGCNTDDKASFITKRTALRVNTSGIGGLSAPLLTGAIDARDKVETVRWCIRRYVNEVTDSARGMIHPSVRRDAALG